MDKLTIGAKHYLKIELKRNMIKGLRKRESKKMGKRKRKRTTERYFERDGVSGKETYRHGAYMRW